MCRLLGIVSRGPIAYDFFEGFADLAWRGNTPSGDADERGHKDGWGFAFYRNGAIVHHVRGTGAASEDSRYSGYAWRVAKTNAERDAREHLVLVAHIRRASPGMPVEAAYAHPFVALRHGLTWSFAHNGGLGDRFRFEERGELDSQYVFRAVLGNLDGVDRDAVVAALRRTRASVREEFPDYTALNLLLSDGRSLHAVRDFAKRGRYYTLCADDLGDSVVVCSERIMDMRGEAVVNGTMLTVGPDRTVARTHVGGRP